MSRYFAFRGRTVIFNARQASGISWDIHATYGWGESTEIYARGIALMTWTWRSVSGTIDITLKT